VGRAKGAGANGWASAASCQMRTGDIAAADSSAVLVQWCCWCTRPARRLEQLDARRARDDDDDDDDRRPGGRIAAASSRPDGDAVPACRTHTGSLAACCPVLSASSTPSPDDAKDIFVRQARQVASIHGFRIRGVLTRRHVTRPPSRSRPHPHKQRQMHCGITSPLILMPRVICPRTRAGPGHLRFCTRSDDAAIDGLLQVHPRPCGELLRQGIPLPVDARGSSRMNVICGRDRGTHRENAKLEPEPAKREIGSCRLFWYVNSVGLPWCVNFVGCH
jgi:hypothetical protein